MTEDFYEMTELLHHLGFVQTKTNWPGKICLLFLTRLGGILLV